MNLKVALFALCLGLVTIPHVSAQECSAEEDAPIDPPKIDEVTKSVNMLIGLPVHQQRRFLLGKQIFSLTRPDDIETDISVPGYNMFKEFGGFSLSENCVVKQESSTSYWGMSESSLYAQSSSSSTGFDMTADIGVSAMGAGAGTSIHNALVYGNSDSSTTTRAMSSAGQSRSYFETAQRDLYSVLIDYERVQENDSWTDEFKGALRDLTTAIDGKSEDEAISTVLEFFRSFGTHGLSRAYFGQKCTSSLYMEENHSQEEYSNLVTEVTTEQKGFKWWSSSESTSQATSTHMNSKNTMSYSIANKECIGNLASDSVCEALAGTGKDAPEILSWSVMPIWDMPLSENDFPGQTKLMMQSAYDYVMNLAEDCSRDVCNGRGACPPKLTEWFSSEPLDQEELFSDSECFCADAYEGESCNEWSNGANVALSKPASQSSTDWSYSRGADLAVDGKTSGIWTDGSIIQTRNEDHPWWKVDLLEPHDITKLIVYPRTDDCPERMEDFRAEIFLRGFKQWSYAHSGRINTATTIYVPFVVGDVVKVTVPHKVNLNLAEVEVYGVKAPEYEGSSNVALRKPASQSSDNENGETPASKAIDGITLGVWTDKKFAETAREDYPWWKVDLLGSYEISQIVVYPRDDDSYLRDFHLSILSHGIEVWSYDYVGNPTTKKTIDTPWNVVGDAVKVTVPGYNFLALAEVEVYGVKAPAYYNVARGKPASQSSDNSSYPGPASLAVDGNTDTDYDNGSVTHTADNEKEPWWKVKLLGEHTITQIVVYHRSGHTYRSEDFKVEILQGTYKEWTYQHSGVPSETTTIPVPNIIGDHVKISVHHDSNNWALNLAEVEVTGKRTGWFKLRYDKADKCLATHSNHHAYLEGCHFGAYESHHWRWTSTGALQNRSDKSLCLDANGMSQNSQLYLKECTGNEWQSWELRDFGSDSEYIGRIFSDFNSNYYLAGQDLQEANDDESLLDKWSY